MNFNRSSIMVTGFDYSSKLGRFIGNLSPYGIQNSIIVLYFQARGGTMSSGVFLDKTHLPEATEIQQMLGSAYPLWRRLVDFMYETYDMPEEFKFATKKEGWCLCYRKYGKSLLWLYPRDNSCNALVVLNQDQTEQALQLNLSQAVSSCLNDAHAYPDGRWLFVTVSSAEVAADIEHLLLLKKKPVKKKAMPTV
jgi:hypothetical protein